MIVATAVRLFDCDENLERAGTDAGDVVAEAVNGGTDRVLMALGAYTLAANVENLTFTNNVAHAGTGNSLNNTIVGGTGIDTAVFTGNLADATFANDSTRLLATTSAGGTDTLIDVEKGAVRRRHGKSVRWNNLRRHFVRDDCAGSLLWADWQRYVGWYC